MASIIKSKSVNIDVAPSESLFLQDNLTWEIRELETNRKKIIKFIKPKKKFMKLYALQNIEMIKSIWDDWVALIILFDCIDTDNCINMVSFDRKVWGTPSVRSRRRARLIKKWIICKEWRLFYLNPCIAIKTEVVNYKLWDLFKDINSKLYWITEL